MKVVLVVQYVSASRRSGFAQRVAPGRLDRVNVFVWSHFLPMGILIHPGVVIAIAVTTGVAMDVESAHAPLETQVFARLEHSMYYVPNIPF